MATEGGPNIVTDGLVLHLDAANAKSFRGEPTVNYITDTPSQGGWSGTYEVLDSSRKTFKLNVSNFAANPGAGWRSFTWDLRAYTGQTVTISATIEVPSTSPGTFAWVMMGQTNTHTNNGSGAGTYLGYSTAGERIYKSTTTKERITWSGILGNSGIASQPSGHVGFTLWYNDGTPGTNSYVEVSDVQIELKPYATPFVNGTRGTTVATGGGWADKSGNNNHGELVNGTTYNLSNGGSIDFDGTNDYMTLPSSMIPATTNWTYSCWFNADTLVAGGVLYCQYTSASGNGRILINLAEENFKLCIRLLSGPGYGSVVVFSNVIPTVGQYYNFVISRNSQTYNLYINGTLNTSYTSTFNANIQQTTPVIGGRSTSQSSPTPASSNFFNGKIAITNIYDRALSDTEILQNYNATKGRFNL